MSVFATDGDRTAANRRLGWILFGVFAALAVLSVVVILARSHQG